ERELLQRAGRKRLGQHGAHRCGGTGSRIVLLHDDVGGRLAEVGDDDAPRRRGGVASGQVLVVEGDRPELAAHVRAPRLRGVAARSALAAETELARLLAVFHEVARARVSALEHLVLETRQPLRVALPDPGRALAEIPGASVTGEVRIGVFEPRAVR